MFACSFKQKAKNKHAKWLLLNRLIGIKGNENWSKLHWLLHTSVNWTVAAASCYLAILLWDYECHRL